VDLGKQRKIRLHPSTVAIDSDLGDIELNLEFSG
jgi:hypothetical protein